MLLDVYCVLTSFQLRLISKQSRRSGHGISRLIRDPHLSQVLAYFPFEDQFRCSPRPAYIYYKSLGSL